MNLIVKSINENIIICEEDKIGKVNTFKIDIKKLDFFVKEGDVIINKNGILFLERKINSGINLNLTSIL